MKKVLSLALVLMMLLTSFAFAEEGYSGTITISLYAQTGVKEAWNAVAEAYEALNPDVDVVVDLKPEDSYADWVKAMFQSYEDTTPEADIVYGNLAGTDRNDKTINFLDYIGEESPYSDYEDWTEQFAFEMQDYEAEGTIWDCLSISGVQVLWFYNVDIFEKVGVQPPKTWDEFVDVCAKIQEAGYQPLALAGDFNSFWAEQMGWLAQAYADQTTRSQIEIVRAQEGDFCYDPDVDGSFAFDPTDPHNDDEVNVTSNGSRFWKAFVKDGTIRADTEGMKTVWSNFAKMFPQYAGGENFYGTSGDGAKTMFFKQDAAIYLSGSWFFGDYLNTMADVKAGNAITIGADENAVELTGLTEFGLGTFAMPSMEGPGIEAPARTIEVATGFLSAVKKDPEHDEMVVDFLKFYTSSQGYSAFMDALIANKGVPDGLPLIKGIELEGELAEMFANIEYIGNCQKGFCQALARGVGDNQEALRAWYTYSMDLLNGKITVDEWAEMHQANQLKYAPEVMEANNISMTDIENPQNEPVGNA